MSQAESDAFHGNLEPSDETAKDSKAPLHLVARTGKPVQLEEQALQVRGKQRAKRFAFMRFDRDRTVTVSFGQPFHFVKQDRLADTSQALFSGLFSFVRPKRTRACSNTASRPTSSGGGEPAPGENGFLMGSMTGL